MKKITINGKRYTWSLTHLIMSWVELLSVVAMIYLVVSWADVVARHSNCESWNFFKILVELGDIYAK